MSKLIGSGFTTAESTFAGTTAGLSSGGSGGGLRIKRITAFAASSAAENTSGGINFVYGESSAVPLSTLTILPGPTSNCAFLTLDGLNIYAKWFEARSNEAGAGGYGIFVFDG